MVRQVRFRWSPEDGQVPQIETRSLWDFSDVDDIDSGDELLLRPSRRRTKLSRQRATSPITPGPQRAPR